MFTVFLTGNCMIKRADFLEKRILSVCAEYGDSYKLKLRNDNIIFTKNDKPVKKVSCHLIFSIFIIGEISISSTLLKKLNSLGISVFFLNHNLSVKASMMSGAEGNYLLRNAQYTKNTTLDTASNIVKAKIQSQEKILKKSKKYNAKIFERAKKQLLSVKDNQQLLGIEGNVSKNYFQTIFKDINWYRRAPQTKEDIPNVLLDIGYTYLFNYCDALLRLFGFDTYKGYYHKLFFQRKSLVCDVMEPMRPIIDYQLVKSFNLKQIREKDFVFRNGRYDFKQGFKTGKHYNSIFLEIINQYKDEIYDFIQQFYKYCMDDQKYKFPEFLI